MLNIHIDNDSRIQDQNEFEKMIGYVLHYHLLRFQTFSSNVLIAINPYEPLPQLYGPQQIEKYRANENLFEKPPHIYAFGNNSFHMLVI